MKVAIITMHCPLNYGAVLQTYALQSYIARLGNDVYIIDYRPKYIVYNQELLYLPDWVKNKSVLHRFAYYMFKIPHKIKRINLFRKFIKRFLNTTPDEYRNYEELLENPPIADRYICGSDQIWGFSNGGYKDPAYFLKFIKDGNICASYAASGLIPNPLPGEMRDISLPMIKRLGHIALREDSSIKAIEKFIDKPIKLVVDPVFLLSKEEWLQIIPKTRYFNERYILVYAVGNNEGTYQLAKHLSQRENLPVYCISGSQRRDARIDKYICPSPTVFLSLFQNANIIVTNSFHGTAFSILFGKRFYVCSTDIASSRITTILNSANCASSLIDVSNIDNALKNWRDTTNSYSSLELLIKESKEYISEILQ